MLYVVKKWKGNIDSILSTLKMMHIRTADIGNRAETTLKRMDKPYYSLMLPLVHRPWLFSKPYGTFHVNSDLRWPFPAGRNGSDRLSEEKSDECMAELLGTGVEKSLCSITSKCILVMTMPQCSGYHLTHQVLYGMVSEQYGCLTQLNVRLGPAHTTIEQLRYQQCANIFFEVSQYLTEHDSQVPHELQDLFMEQEFICPNAGYIEFLHYDWLELIMSWQKPSGCWGTSEKGSLSSGKTVDRFQNLKDALDFPEYKKFRSLPMFRDASSGKTTGFKRRHLLYEKSMAGGCFSHKTAVALGALTQYLRFLLLANNSGIDACEHLRGVNYLRNPSYLLRRSTTTLPAKQSENGRVKMIIGNSEDVFNDRLQDWENEERSPKPPRDGGVVDDSDLEIDFQEEMRDSLSAARRSTMRLNSGYNDKHNIPDNGVGLVLDNRRTEPAVTVFYRNSDGIMGLDAFASSLPYVYVFMLLISVFAMSLLYRLLRRHLRFRYRMF